MYLLSLTWGYYIISNYFLIGKTLSYDDDFLTLVVGNLSSLANGTFRILFGYFYD